MQGDRAYPVLNNFDARKIIGVVKELAMEGRKLIATISLFQENLDLLGKAFSFTGKINSSHKDRGTKVIDDFDLVNVSLINKENNVYTEIREEIIYADD